jgi:hypothetical protein
LKLNKAEAPGVAGYSVAYDLCESDGVTVLFEPALQFCFAARVGYVSNEQSQHGSKSPLNGSAFERLALMGDQLQM